MPTTTLYQFENGNCPGEPKGRAAIDEDELRAILSFQDTDGNELMLEVRNPGTLLRLAATAADLAAKLTAMISARTCSECEPLLTSNQTTL